ncbi:MAG: DJ-1/PfpI family protein [Spirochaetota bacterium]|jgi:protease I|nr:DJ-1/PfpI family protein [Spirochaetota bacterium]
MARIVLIIAQEGFRDEEYAVPRRILADAGHEVRTASRARGVAMGKLGMRTEAEFALDELKAADFGAIICVGGPGSTQFWDDAPLHTLLCEGLAQGKIIGGICSAAVTLARAGVLQGKRATVFPGDADEFKPYVGQYTAGTCERDGLCVTANGPAAAEEFGNTIRDALQRT